MPKKLKITLPAKSPTSISTNELEEIKEILKTLKTDMWVVKNDVKMLKIDESLNTIKLNTNIRKLYEEVDHVRRELSKQIITLNNKIDQNVMNKLDSIIKSIRNAEEEREIITYRSVNHGERIEKLEIAVLGKPSE